MLRELQIGNFKAWKDTGRLRIAPLTVFFGTNSSGKTSLLQLLLMLKQTAESADRRRVLHTGDSHTPVDLGTFHDLIHGHNADATLDIELQWSLEESLKFQDPHGGQKFIGNELWFHAEVESRDRGLRPMTVREMAYRLGDPDRGGLVVCMTPRDEEPGKYDLQAQGYRLVRNPGRKWPLPSPLRFYGFPDEAVAYFQNTAFLADFALEMEKLLRRIYYVGPLREYPQRTYLWSGEVPEFVGFKGERAVEALLAASRRSISPGYKKRRRPFQSVIALWLERLGLIESFEIRPLAENRKDYEVLVRTRKRDSRVNLTDVGFGVSQILPVLVQSFYAPPGSTVIFEQPEIHLHPRVQAALADLFIEAIHAREEGDDRRLQLLIESHSEHFLRRLQRRVAEEKLDPEKVAIYFCEPGPDGARIEELDLDEFGNIRNWPPNFFGDEMGDLTAMTEAAMRRQLTGTADS